MPSLLLLALITLCSPARAGADVVAFEDVRVLTMGPAGVLERAVVLVAGERIVAVGTPAEVEIPDGARRIDGQGFTLMPGLIDLHVHVGDEVDLDLYVACGVTTVRDLGGSLWHLGLADRVASGQRLGPTLHVSSPTISGVSEPEEARAIARRQAALVTAAREAGIRPCGHIPRNLTVEDVLATPPDSIDHAEEFLYGWFDGRRGRESIPELAEWMREAKTPVVATLTCYDTIGRQVASFERAFDRGEVRYASAYNWRNWAADRNQYRRFERRDVVDLRAALDLQKEFLAAFHEVGVPLLMGTDSGSEGVPFVLPGFSAHDELLQLAECGLSNADVLAAATREAAAFLGVLDEVGTIEAGRRADMILVMGDPLTDLRNTTLRAGVMLRGRWLPADEIDALLETIAAQSKREAEFIRRLTVHGASAAVTYYEECVARDAALILEQDLDLAHELFRLNARAYPQSWNVHDCLGEVLAARGELQAAIPCYEEALRLEPRHVDGKRRADELRAELAAR